MKEYTIIALFSVVAALAVGWKLKTRIFLDPLFWVFMVVIFLFKLMVNGYLTGALIVIYNTRYFMDYRLGSIPFEDFMFGFSMVSLTIIFWEYFKEKAA